MGYDECALVVIGIGLLEGQFSTELSYLVIFVGKSVREDYTCSLGPSGENKFKYRKTNT